MKSTKEEIDAMTDAQVVSMVSCHSVGTYRGNVELRKRMEAIASRLDRADKDNQ